MFKNFVLRLLFYVAKSKLTTYTELRTTVDFHALQRNVLWKPAFQPIPRYMGHGQWVNNGKRMDLN